LSNAACGSWHSHTIATVGSNPFQSGCIGQETMKGGGNISWISH
jgi:hypothetical protein